MPHHVLVTVLGKNARETTYLLNDRESTACLAPIALFDLLPDTDKPDLVLALCTEEAKHHTFPILDAALRHRVAVSCVDVPSGVTQQDVDDFMSSASRAIIFSDCKVLSVDVTHGFRHLSFLTYLIVLYVSALKRLEVRGAYYGLQQDGIPSGFLDLRPLLELPDWIHGIRVLSETGSAAPIASVLSLRPDTSDSRSVAQDLERISAAHLSGLPLEVGFFIRQLLEKRIKCLRRSLRVEHHLPLADELVEELRLILDPLGLPDGYEPGGWKKGLRITKAELGRQALFINRLLEQRNTAAAVGMMREWIVSWVLWQQRGEDAMWLDRNVRRKEAEWTLNSLCALRGKRTKVKLSLDDSQERLAQLWGDLISVRNGFHHHGMRREQMVGEKSTDHRIHRIVESWEWLSSCPRVSLDFSQGKTLLVSPIGKLPGVLFSAVSNCYTARLRQPDCCMVICSSDTEGYIQEALDRADYSGLVVRVCMNDPYGGHQEMSGLISDSLEHLVAANEVFVNLTGGTTLMGLLAQRIGEEARRLGRSVRRFGLVDRRSPAEQDANPYVVAESFWLDKTEDAADEDDD
jgi:CRISPR-associated DxTHG motif protein